MKYSAFEQAAVEASTGVKEIDAEIERLRAKRELLTTLMHQLLAVLPTKNDSASSSDGGARAGEIAPAGDAEPASFADSAAESNGASSSARKEEWSGYSAVAVASDTAVAEKSPFADLLTQTKPFSLRNEGWPAASPSDQRGIRERL